MLNRIKAFGYGLQDGWQQPYELSSNRNTDHLGGWQIREVGDRGINVGQLVRAGVRSQVWRERMWPVAWVKGGER